MKLTRLVRGELDWIVMKALDKERSRRYETANGLARDVQRYLADETVEACPPSAGYRLRKFVRKHRAGLTTAAAIIFLLATGVAVSTWQAIRATQAESAGGGGPGCRTHGQGAGQKERPDCYRKGAGGQRRNKKRLSSKRKLPKKMRSGRRGLPRT